jgi:hypothetical protein
MLWSPFQSSGRSRLAGGRIEVARLSTKRRVYGTIGWTPEQFMPPVEQVSSPLVM